jgi:REP element-mobilizing transposase RayT
MSEKYKTHEDGLYFISFSVVGWADVFVRRKYQDILIESIKFCQLKKNLKLYCYCIMPSHVHLIAYSENGSISNVLRDLKSFTANEIINDIKNNNQESRKEWLLELFKKHGDLSPQKQLMQFWKHDNHPFYLYSNEMILQKMDYIHNNPVLSGFVNYPRRSRKFSPSLSQV